MINTITLNFFYSDDHKARYEKAFLKVGNDHISPSTTAFFLLMTSSETLSDVLPEFYNFEHGYAKSTTIPDFLSSGEKALLKLALSFICNIDISLTDIFGKLDAQNANLALYVISERYKQFRNL